MGAQVVLGVDAGSAKAHAGLSGAKEHPMPLAERPSRPLTIACSAATGVINPQF